VQKKTGMAKKGLKDRHCEEKLCPTELEKRIRFLHSYIVFFFSFIVIALM